MSKMECVHQIHRLHSTVLLEWVAVPKFKATNINGKWKFVVKRLSFHQLGIPLTTNFGEVFTNLSLDVQIVL